MIYLLESPQLRKGRELPEVFLLLRRVGAIAPFSWGELKRKFEMNSRVEKSIHWLPVF